VSISVQLSRFNFSKFCRHQHRIPIRIDHQTRRDRTERRDRAFDEQTDACAEAYMNWNYQLPSEEVEASEGASPAGSRSIRVKIVGIYGKFSFGIPCSHL